MSGTFANVTQVEVSEERFEAMVADALDEIPEELASKFENVAVMVQDWPTAAQLGGRRGTLLGLYEGIDLPRRSPLGYSGVMPDRITIFRGPLCARAHDEVELAAQVRVTVLHEVGHYFGMSENAVARAGLGVARVFRTTDRWRNWGRNQHSTPAAIDEPRSLLEVVESVETAASAGQTVKVVASGHSFSDVAVTTGRMLRIGALDRVVAVDRDAMTATVEAGIPLWVLNDELAKRDLALSNLGDIDRQTIAGATSTGTHGTGLRYGSIAAAIVGLELVTASGDVVRCSATEEPEIFHCARASASGCSAS